MSSISDKILYKGSHGRIAHEFLIDIRPFKEKTGVTEDDVAKRLMDFGIHGPTISFPVPGALMIEPTESEDKGEIDRLIDALIRIRSEIDDIEKGNIEKYNNPLVNSPHTLEDILDEE